MKAISTIIATVIMVVIVIGLVSTAYLFMGGILTGTTAKVISLIDARRNMIIVRNDGTDTINQGDITILVNGEEAEIVNSQDINPQNSAVLKFVPPEPEMRAAKVVVLGASNTLSFTTDIIPHSPKVTPDTVGLWHLDSINSTGYTLDETSYDNDAYVDGATLDNDCMVGSCFSFAGGTDNINVGNDASLDMTDAITIMAWIHPTSWPSNYPRIVSKESGKSAEPYALELDQSNSRAMLCLNTGTGEDCFTFTGTNSISLNQWYHVAGTWNSTDTKIYLNGEERGGKSLGGAMVASVNSVRIGMNDPALLPIDQRPFQGRIDEVIILDKALTHEEILDSIYG